MNIWKYYINIIIIIITIIIIIITKNAEKTIVICYLETRYRGNFMTSNCNYHVAEHIGALFRLLFRPSFRPNEVNSFTLLLVTNMPPKHKSWFTNDRVNFTHFVSVCAR